MLAGWMRGEMGDSAVEVLRGPLGQYSRNIAESTQEKSWP